MQRHPPHLLYGAAFGHPVAVLQLLLVKLAEIVVQVGLAVVVVLAFRLQELTNVRAVGLYGHGRLGLEDGLPAARALPHALRLVRS